MTEVSKIESKVLIKNEGITIQTIDMEYFFMLSVLDKYVYTDDEISFQYKNYKILLEKLSNGIYLLTISKIEILKEVKSEMCTIFITEDILYVYSEDIKYELSLKEIQDFKRERLYPYSLLEKIFFHYRGYEVCLIPEEETLYYILSITKKGHEDMEYTVVNYLNNLTDGYAFFGSNSLDKENIKGKDIDIAVDIKHMDEINKLAYDSIYLHTLDVRNYFNVTPSEKAYLVRFRNSSLPLTLKKNITVESARNIDILFVSKKDLEVIKKSVDTLKKTPEEILANKELRISIYEHLLLSNGWKKLSCE